MFGPLVALGLLALAPPPAGPPSSRKVPAPLPVPPAAAEDLDDAELDDDGGECARGSPVLYLATDPEAYARVVFEWKRGAQPAATESAWDDKGKLVVQVEHAGCAHFTVSWVLPDRPGAEAPPAARLADAVKRLRRIKVRVPDSPDGPVALAAALEQAAREGKAEAVLGGHPIPHGDAVVEVERREAGPHGPAALVVTYDFPL